MGSALIKFIAVGVLGAAVTGPVPASAVEPITADGPPVVTPADIRFQHRTLRPGSPREVGLLPEYVARLREDAASYLVPTPDHPRWPTYAGAVVLAAKDGVIVEHAAVGTAVRYSGVGPPPARVGIELPADQQIATRPDTIFDLASVS
ncbi:MAG TPA: hypothetical protein VFM37_15480, partial [Pseudonocardiaceae bacterium]|nr:hypothetical protein [Pseudonocardiaceae bacterium]